MAVSISPDAQDRVTESQPETAVAAATQNAQETATGANTQPELNGNNQSVTTNGEMSIFDKATALMNNDIPFTDAITQCREINSGSATPMTENDLVKTVKSAYGLETETLHKLIKQLNKKHAVINVGGKCRVMTEFIDPDTGLRDIQFSSPADFRSFYANRKVTASDGRDMTLGVLWFMDPWRREYEGVTFNPRLTPPSYYNLWTGFAVEAREGNCTRFLAHIRDNIASGNKAIYEYIIAWMAQCVQRPDELIGVALALRGSMGTGKGVFANVYGSLFGRHFLQLTQGSQLTGKFNAHMKDKCAVFADEAFWAGDKQAEGVLKALITEPSLIIEGKGENAFKIKNHLHFIFATNNEWVAPAGPQERRFFVIDVGERHMQDHAYFEAILDEMDNGGREALLHYLLSYDISGINLRQFPQTAALMEQKLYSMSPVHKFIFEKLESGALSNSVNGWDEVPTKDLYSQFIAFCIHIGERYKPSPSEFGVQLKKLFSGVTAAKGRQNRYGSVRPNVYRFPSLDECRRTFERFINYQVEWPVYADEPASAQVLPAPDADAALTVVE